MEKEDKEVYTPRSRKDWRQWLKKNHRTKPSVWLVYYKKDTGIPTVAYGEAVEEALCYGWIDSTRKSLGDDRYAQLFCKRKPGSVWSKINKAKVQRLIGEGLMTPAGFESIETAKANGSWTILDSVEALKIPKDLEKEFRNHPGAKNYFNELSKSTRKAILQWLILAKRPETRQKRINEIAQLAGQKMKPKQF